MKRLLAVALAAVAFSYSSMAHAEKVMANGASVGKWTQDFDAASALAAEKGLPMLLNFTGSDWCYWCKLMEKRVFSQSEWTSWAKDNIVLVFVNFPSNKKLVPKKYVERNKTLAEKYGIEGYPTFILLSSDGGKVLGQLGASREPSPADFISQITARLEANSPKP